MPNRKTSIQEWINRFAEAHGDTYEYNSDDIAGAKTKIPVTCKSHGIFMIAPSNFAYGKGCPKCGRERTLVANVLTDEQIMKKFIEAHGDRYDYSEVVFDGYKGKVTIICREHGPFAQAAEKHYMGKGCRKCAEIEASDRLSWSIDQFVDRARTVHGDKYSYDKSIFVNTLTKLTITCPEHGDFEQTPGHHIRGVECPICGRKNSGIGRRMSDEDFISKCKARYGDLYTYDKIDRSGDLSSIIITCRRHGDFATSATKIANHAGCPSCAEEKGTSMPERVISSILTKHGIEFVAEKRFSGCRDKALLRFDFFVAPDILIEYDGPHHFFQMGYGKGKHSRLDSVNRRDRIKNKFAKQNGYHLIRIPYTTKNIELKLKKELAKIGINLQA